MGLDKGLKKLGLACLGPRDLTVGNREGLPYTMYGFFFPKVSYRVLRGVAKVFGPYEG